MKKRIIALLLVMLMLCASAAADSNPSVSTGHALLEDMNAGPCKSLTGAVQLVVLIVSIGDEPWTDAEIVGIRQEAQTACRMLRSEAAAYGATLNISLKFHTLSAADAPPMRSSGDWMNGVLRDVPGLSGAIHGTAWANTPLMVFCSTPGRAFAVCQSDDYHAEYAILYRGDDSGVIRHELMHLFGAEDYYVEDAIAGAAQRLCPNSIMLHSDYTGTVDDLTAYIIGWTEMPGENGLQLLRETADVSVQSYSDSRISDQQSGLQTLSDASTTYTGMVDAGVANGWGHIIWNNGDSYLGHWVQGAREGMGLYAWADGTVFAGTFANGMRTGWGATQWANGSSYVGGYQDGVRDGQGTYIWADGSVYSGSFVNGERTGQGSLINADGTMYTGSFLNGQYNGRGTLVFADGSSYTGEFLNGRLHGEGTYRWANGSSYTGDFADGQRHGHGVYRSKDGAVLEGEWINNVYAQ